MYCVWIPLSLMGKLDNIGVENAEISYDNEGPRNSEWYNPVPYCENEIHAISVSRSPSINTTTLKNIVKVRTSSSDRSFKNKKKKIIASRGDSSSKLHNKSIARFNPSASEDVSEDEEAETAQLLPVPPAGKSIQIMPVAVAVAVSATSEYSLEAGRR